MNTLTKLALGLIGQFKPLPPVGDATPLRALLGAMAQNVYLYCASEGLATVIRAWFDRAALGRAMGLQTDHQWLLSQTVGAIKPAQVE